MNGPDRGKGRGRPCPEADRDREEIRPLLRDEVGRLPEKYRAPVVLCFFEGQTHEEAARQLDCPSGTVKGRLARAKVLLSMYGMPLRVGMLPMSAAESKEYDGFKDDLNKMRMQRQSMGSDLAALKSEFAEKKDETLKLMIEKKDKEIGAVHAKIVPLEERERVLKHGETQASVDSSEPQPPLP